MDPELQLGRFQMEEKRLRAEFQMNLSRESPHGGQCYRGPGGAPDLLLSLGVREAFAPADFRAVLARVAEDRNAIDRPLSEPQLELCVALVRPGACFPTVAVDGGRSPPPANQVDGIRFGVVGKPLLGDEGYLSKKILVIVFDIMYTKQNFNCSQNSNCCS